MPSRRKSLMFAFASFTSVCSFVIVCLVLATQYWMSSQILFSERNATATIFITYGLFGGFHSKTLDPGIDIQEKNFQVAALLNSKLKTFNSVIIALLVFNLISSLLSSGFTLYNALSNPYQTFLGPIGIYTWNAISSVCTLLTLILFAVNVEVNKASVEMAFQVFHASGKYELLNTYGYSYWIMLLIVALNTATITTIVFYQKARYSKKKEQKRPMEIAPKDGILF